MLVEDDNNLREIYEARLQAEGYTIVSARDGEEALVVAKAEKPDLIISDVMMPKISGFEMLDILRNTEGLKDVKVMMLTALGQSDDQQRADRLGADRYLVKSQVTLEDIVKVAHELLQDETTVASQVEVPTTISTAPAPATPAPTPSVAPVPPPVIEPPKEVADTPPTATVPPADNTKTEPATSTVNESVPQSTAQEEASVEARIEDFVAGATQEAEPPVSAAPAESVANQEVTVAPEPAPTTSQVEQSSNEKADDNLMANAVQTLSASIASGAQDTIPDIITPSAEAQKPTPLSAEPELSSAASVAVAGKKVIAPPDDEPKKNIETLLAIENATQAAKAPLTTPAAVIATDEAGASSVPLTIQPETNNTNPPVATASAAPSATVSPTISPAASATPPAAPVTNDKIDPNSIAL